MKKITFAFLLTLTILPVYGFAQQTQPNTGPTPPQTVPNVVPISIPNPVSGVNSLTDLFYKIVNFIISFSYVVIAFFLILSGFKFVAAQGSEDKLKDAKNTFKYTIIGALLIIGAQTIINVVRSIITQLGS